MNLNNLCDDVVIIILDYMKDPCNFMETVVHVSEISEMFFRCYDKFMEIKRKAYLYKK